ncbi:MAG: MBL fold metallo-hydrolase [Pseudomonadota bacterium]
MLCKIGDVEIWRILEINAPFLTPEELFPTAGPEVTAVFGEHGRGLLDAASGRLILPVQGFLLNTPKHVILVDSCVGNHKTNNYPDWHQRDDDRFMAALKAAGVGPDDVDYVLCTHLHPDHIGWNTRLEDGRWVPTFPNARYLMPAADEAMLSDLGHVMHAESVAPVIAAGQAELVSGEHALGDEVTLVPTPGHSPGHVSVLIRSAGAEAVITGDAIHTTVQCRRPDWEFVYDHDGAMAVASRKKLLEDASESGRRVLGSHFSMPSIGRVKADGDSFKWEPE